MRKAMLWIVDRWWIPALVIVAVVSWLLFRRRNPNPTAILGDVQTELDVIRAGAEARETEIVEGTVKTVQQIKDKYAAKTVALDATQMLKVKELEDDPIALARYLERLTRG